MMMEMPEAKSAAKALYLQAAALAGREVSPFSPERLVDIVNQGFSKVTSDRRGEAVANLLRLIAMTLELAQQSGHAMLQETDVDAAHKTICPVYPF
jgi:hypothetical protein